MGKFDFVADVGPRGMPLRVYTPPGKARWGAYALNVTKHALVYFEKIFEFNYPQQKLDSVRFFLASCLCVDLLCLTDRRAGD